MLYEKERKQLCKVVKSNYDRWLTNAAGGNFSIKVDEDRFVMSPTLAATTRLWDLDPEDILVVDKDLNVIEGNGKITREINMHMVFYEEDPKAKAVIHSHPKEMMVYAAMGIDLPLVCENVMKLGNALPCLKYAPATTKELAERVRVYVKEKVAKEENSIYGALLAGHGTILCGSDIMVVNDMLERLETNAYTHLQMVALEKAGYKNKMNYDMKSDE